MQHINPKAYRNKYIITITRTKTLSEEIKEIICKTNTNESLNCDPCSCQDFKDRKDEIVLENKSENHIVLNHFSEGKYEILQTLSPPSADINGIGSISKSNHALKIDPTIQKALDVRPPEKIEAGSCSCYIF
ncbi:hypothetical protein SteCoe_14033 [Stentor coeruleus]|uniref:Uncharacterized protein n=1 Tax=Stentor coeruleus TaxID=5963 RepID=A0A1R2C710_9CILI|nr:hypothetical protein SteCoe_14033 [Stentor coeruleus]